MNTILPIPCPRCEEVSQHAVPQVNITVAYTFRCQKCGKKSLFLALTPGLKINDLSAFILPLDQGIMSQRYSAQDQAKYIAAVIADFFKEMENPRNPNIRVEVRNIKIIGEESGTWPGLGPDVELLDEEATPDLTAPIGDTEVASLHAAIQGLGDVPSFKD